MGMAEQRFRKHRLAAGLLITAQVLAAGGAALAAPKDPSGVYLTEDGRARVRVEKCSPVSNKICGYVVWMKAAAGENVETKRDRKNPDAARTVRLLLGHQIMLGLAPFKDESYQGLIYNNEDGKSYSVTIYMEGETLKVKGCLVAFLCKTETWTRADDIAPGQLAGVTGTPTGPQPHPEWRLQGIPAESAKNVGGAIPGIAATNKVAPKSKP